METEYTSASICTSGGVYEQGLPENIKSIWGVEINPDVAAIYRLNYPNSKIYCQDVCTVNFHGLERPNFLHASPSCRSYSQLNNKKETDKDIAVGQAIAKAIAHFKPEVFTLENVTDYRNSRSWAAIKTQLKDLGYKFTATIQRMRVWGIPQKQRNRFIVIATREYGAITLIPTNRTNYWYECIEDLIPDLIPSKLTQTQIDHFTDKTKKAIAAGETVLLKRNQIRATTGAAYRDEPYCWTPTATLATDHLNKNRKRFADLVTEEGTYRVNIKCLARIQTIPDTYLLPERVAVSGLIVGNAVPPLFVKQMWEQILNTINKVNSDRERSPSQKSDELLRVAIATRHTDVTKSRAISFGYTAKELLSGRKTCTRRKWKPVTAKTFARYYEEGRLIPACDKSLRNGGKEIAKIKLTCEPYLEKLADMPESDLAKEGGMCRTIDEFINTYFKGDRNLEVSVIRFEVVNELLQTQKEDNLSQLDAVSDKLFPKTCPKNSRVAIATRHTYVAEEERIKLEQLILSKGNALQSFYEIGLALTKIKSDKLYLAVNSNFYDYCNDKFEIKRTTIKQYLSAVKVRDNLQDILEDSGVQILESHCRALAKLEKGQQREVLSEAIANKELTAAGIKRAAMRVVKFEQKERSSRLLVPEENTIVGITGRHEPDIVKYKGYWGLVTASYNSSCNVRVMGAELQTVHPQYLLKFNNLRDSEAHEVLSLLERLDAIYNSPEMDHSIKIFLQAIAQKKHIVLSEWEDYLLSKIENRIDGEEKHESIKFY